MMHSQKNIKFCKTLRYSRRLIALYRVSQSGLRWTQSGVPIQMAEYTEKFEIPKNIAHIPQNIAVCPANNNTGVIFRATSHPANFYTSSS